MGVYLICELVGGNVFAVFRTNKQQKSIWMQRELFTLIPFSR